MPTGMFWLIEIEHSYMWDCEVGWLCQQSSWQTYDSRRDQGIVAPVKRLRDRKIQDCFYRLGFSPCCVIKYQWSAGESGISVVSNSDWHCEFPRTFDVGAPLWCGEYHTSTSLAPSSGVKRELAASGIGKLLGHLWAPRVSPEIHPMAILLSNTHWPWFVNIRPREIPCLWQLIKKIIDSLEGKVVLHGDRFQRIRKWREPFFWIMGLVHRGLDDTTILHLSQMACDLLSNS